MKHKLLRLLGVTTLLLTATSCGKPEIAKPKVLTLFVTLNKNPLVVGDSFFDYANVELKAYYKSGMYKIINNDAATFHLTCRETKQQIYQPLATHGQFELVASYNGLVSNIYRFNVAKGKVYAESASLEGAHSKLAYNRTQRVKLNVTPSDYSEAVEFTQSTDQSVATIEQVDRYNFDVHTYSEGTCSFSFSVYSSREEKLTIPYNLEVTEIYATSIVSKGPDTLGIGSKIQVSVEVEPEDCTMEVDPINFDDEIATVVKIDDFTFEITGHSAGEANIRFKVLDTEWTCITAEHTVTVQPIAKTNIEQTYLDLTKIKSYQTACPNSGDVKLLVIPIWFNDSASFIKEDKKDTVVEDIRNVIFGDEVSTGWQSLATFYHEESNGELTITGTVGDWYRPKIDDAYVDAAYYAEDKDGRTKALTLAAVNDYFTNNPSDDRKDYDYDGDGFMDGVLLYYAAPNYITYKRAQAPGYGEGKENLWAYKTSLNNISLKNVNSPGPNTFYWCSYDFIYGSNIVQDHTGYNYSYGNTRYCKLDSSVVIHEMGHMFGLNDLYDYVHEASHAGSFSTQDNNGGGHDPYSMISLGWADPYIPTESCTITLNDFQSSGEVILLTPEFNPYNSPFDEYLLLELYTPTGLNYLDTVVKGVGPNVAGIRLWHVDAVLYKTSGTNFTRNVFDTGVSTTAFNNTSKSKAEHEKGRNCAAYVKDPIYQKYCMLHMIRNDLTKDYMCNERLIATDLFGEGSTFSFEMFKNQFVKTYLGETPRMDFGQQLGWEFTVGPVVDYQTGQYSVTVTLTKTI